MSAALSALDQLALNLRRDLPAQATREEVRRHVDQIAACLDEETRVVLVDKIVTAAPGRAACEWCGGEATTGTCPRSIECPTCGAGAGQSCKRPSGHRAAQLHADRIRIAELDVVDDLLADPADHECDCCCPGCTDLFRPEDAAEALLEAERAAAAEKPRRIVATDQPRARAAYRRRMGR